MVEFPRQVRNRFAWLHRIVFGLTVCGGLLWLNLQADAASREPVRGRHGMVASANGLASAIGVDILKRGGNAVDAAVAVAMALAVAYPQAGNLGGGGFMLIHLKNGRTTAIDYRETAPAAATRNLYLDAKGQLIHGESSSTIGYRAVGVPGTVAGMQLALQRYGSGKLSWSQLLEPARHLAAGGYTVSHSLARALQSSTSLLALYPETRRIFLNGGRGYHEGDILRQTELAATLRRLQQKGPREFYTGQTAYLIAAAMRRHHGLITQKDLHAYQPRERVPLHGTYRGFEIVSMPPPSSGGAVLLEMLNILEGYDLHRMGWSSAATDHLMLEAMRRAFADRAAYMGDTDFVRVPIAGMVDKAYAARLRAGIDPEKASSSATVQAGAPPGTESTETTHFTVVDAAGNAVSNTYTLNGLFGSGVVAAGTGVLLNDEMDDFAAKPGAPNQFGLVQNERNAIQPRKRPLSSMAPTFVLRKDGSLWFALGSPGGPTIINTVLQIILNVIDHGMNIQQAVDAPRLHHQWLPDEVEWEPFGLPEDTRRLLVAQGYKLAARPRQMGDAQAVMIEAGSGVRLGASDPRGDGAAVGY